ncbi:MAG: DUF58 domain-containing protein [SAR202 cluster bacterium]|nr:DUF58 domain-containing protein [SAR202 cluster bacterium]
MGQGLIIAFGVMGLLAMGISWAWNRMSLADVSYVRHLPLQRVFLGEVISLRVTLTNKKPVPLLWVSVEDEVPDALEVVEGDIAANIMPDVQTLRHLTSMSWYERVKWDYRLRCVKRGMYRIGPARLESGDPFGFLRSRKHEPKQDYLVIYPRVYPLEDLGIPSARPLGDVKGGLAIFPDPARPAGIRDYRVGDPLKTVDWKATARQQRLQVCTYEPSTTYTVILIVAVDTVEPFWGAYVPEDLERVISTAASVAHYGVERHFSVGLFANDMPAVPGRPMTVMPSYGLEQLSVILGALANVRAYAIGPMSAQLSQNAGRFPLGSTLAVFTALLNKEFAAALDDLKHRGYKVVVFYLGEKEPPPIPDGVVFHSVREHMITLEEAGQHVAG